MLVRVNKVKLKKRVKWNKGSPQVLTLLKSMIGSVAAWQYVNASIDRIPEDRIQAANATRGGKASA